MKKYMAALCCLPVLAASAAPTITSVSRTVESYGSVGVESWLDSKPNSAAGDFDAIAFGGKDIDDNGQGGAAGSLIRQVSSVSPLAINVSMTGSGARQGRGIESDANASSGLDVVLDLAEPHNFSLTGSWSFSVVHANALVLSFSMDGNEAAHDNREKDVDSGNATFTGVLQPGQHRLTVFANANSGLSDETFADFRFALQGSLTLTASVASPQSVPESSPDHLDLASIGLLGLCGFGIAFRRKA